MTRTISLALPAFLAWALVSGLASPVWADGPFAIKDGDRIVFYGDDNTDQRLYTTFVENYIVTRFPTLNVSFVHSGWRGDRVTGGAGGSIDKRLARDVFAYKPTVVTVMLGMNDAGFQQPFDQPRFDAYAKGYQHLVESIKREFPDVRLTLIQPSPYDNVTRKSTNGDEYHQVLLRYGEFAKELARKEGATVVDLNTPVVAALKKAMEIDPAQAKNLMAETRSSQGGALLMAEAILKAWNAPAVVSTVELDAVANKVVKQENTKVDNFQTHGTISWTQLDSALPMPIGLRSPINALAVKASDVEQALNQQTLKVSGLTAPQYELRIDGKAVAELTEEQLASGVNLAERQTPMFNQAMAVMALTFQHNNIHFQRWRSLQVPFETRDSPTLAKAIEGLDALERDIIADQRARAKPMPHRFELVPRIDPAATHVRLVVIPAAKDSGKPAVVALGKPIVTEDLSLLKDIEHGILARELVRQSLLIAARDELGLATRDEVAGDSQVAHKQEEGKDKEGASVELLTLFRPGKTSRALVRRTEGAKVDVLLDQDLGADKSLFSDLAKFVTVAEALSRTEFPGVLKKLGLDGKTKAPSADRALPAGVEDRLSQLGFTEILSAVRDLHAANRSDGESPARIGALVRGYSLLGVLSEFHWHPAHKVFKARALLYAQRLVAKEPDSAWGLWHRAYAEALIGLNQHATADLVQARVSAKAQHIAKPPGWVEVIDASAQCDLKRLKIDGGPQAGLTSLLRLAIVEFPGTPSVVVQAAKDVLGIDPECYRAIDAMCAAGGVSNLHVATLLGPQMLEEAFPQRLGALDKLPAKVREQLDQQAGGEVALVDALIKAGQPDADAGEPSWGVLGHLIRETRFIQVYRRLHFMKVWWGVPFHDYWAESHRLVADHPYRLFLEAFVAPPNEVEQTYARLVQTLDLQGLEITQAQLTVGISSSSKLPKAQNAWNFAWYHADDIARDRAMMLSHTNKEYQAQAARSLLTVSPHSPFARATLIEHDWDKVKDQVGQWEKEAGESPTLLAALARRYTELKKFDEAERSLKAYIKISPDLWGYQLLADNYKARNDLKRWQETLDDFLDRGEDLGLDHARVGVDLAEHFMRQKLWDKAWPYAESAAETWAQWAMDCARRCAEGMEKWDEAAQWAQRLTERYPESDWAMWYLCCKRTGHGDVDGARDFTKPYVAAIGHPYFVGTFQWLNGERKEAFATFKKFHEASPSSWTCLQLIMVADDSSATAKAREAFFKILVAKHREQAPQLAQVWEMFHQALDRSKEGSVDLKAVDKLLESVPTEQRGINELLVGKYLANHGKAEDARRYLTITLKSPVVPDWTKALAGDALSKLGSNPKAQKAADTAK